MKAKYNLAGFSANERGSLKIPLGLLQPIDEFFMNKPKPAHNWTEKTYQEATASSDIYRECEVQGGMNTKDSRMLSVFWAFGRQPITDSAAARMKPFGEGDISIDFDVAHFPAPYLEAKVAERGIIRLGNRTGITSYAVYDVWNTDGLMVTKLEPESNLQIAEPMDIRQLIGALGVGATRECGCPEFSAA